jgi:hypothetical protein
VTWHGAILRGAAVLAPREGREEWLREWRAELCYVDRGRTGFCFGAYRDALWLRRNAARRPWLDSPFACLVALLGLVAISGAIALNEPVSAPVPGALGPFRSFLAIVGYACVIMPSTTRFSLGEYPANGCAFRRWVFLAAKLLLVLALFYFGAMTSTHLRHAAGSGILFLLWSCIFAFRWILADQRRRCPVCLHLLSHPVHVGQASRIFLGWDGTEFLCRKGHGLLHVPQTPTSWYGTQRWLSLDT